MTVSWDNLVCATRRNYYYITVNGKYVYTEEGDDKFSIEIVKEKEDSTITFSEEHTVKLVKVINIIFNVNIEDIKVYHVIRDTNIIKDEYQIDIARLI